MTCLFECHFIFTVVTSLLGLYGILLVISSEECTVDTCMYLKSVNQVETVRIIRYRECVYIYAYITVYVYTQRETYTNQKQNQTIVSKKVTFPWYRECLS